MADPKLQIVINAKDNASKILKNTNTEVKKMNGNFQNTTKITKNTNDSFTRLAKGAFGVYIGFVGLQKAFNGTIGAAIKFESAFAGVRKTVDASEPEFAILSQNFRNLAKTIPVSVEELSKIGELGGQLGVGINDLTKFTEIIAKVGVTTNLTTEQAATDFARISNIMSLPLENVDRLGSTIVELGNNFATTESEISSFAQRIAAAGKLAGLTVANVLSISAAFSSVGIEAETGGTAVQKVLLKINNSVNTSSKNLTIFADVAGKSAKDFAKLWKEDAGQAFNDFVVGLGQQGDNASGILKLLGLANERTQRAFLSLANAGDLITESLETGNIAWSENTALNIEAAKRFATTASKVEIAKNKFNDIGITLGSVFLPVLSKVMEAVSDFALIMIDTGKLIGTLFKIIGKTLVTSIVGAISGAVLQVKEKANVILNIVDKLMKKIGMDGISFRFNTDGILSGGKLYEAMIGSVGDDIEKLKEQFLSVGSTTTKSVGESKKSYEELNKEIDKIINSNDDTGESTDKLASKLENLAKEYGDLQKEAQQSLKELQFDHDEKITQIEKKLSGLNIKYQETTEDMDKALSNIKESHDVNLKSISDSITEVESRMSDLRSSLEKTKTSNIENLADSFVKAQDSIAELEKQISESTNFEEKQGLQEELAKQQTALAQYADLQAQYQEQIDAAREYANLTDLERAVLAFEEKNRMAQEEFDVKMNLLSQEITALNEKRTLENKQFNARLQEINNEYNKKLSAITQEIADVTLQKEQEIKLFEEKTTLINAIIEDSEKYRQEQTQNTYNLTEDLIGKEIDLYKQLATAIRDTQRAKGSSLLPTNSSIPAFANGGIVTRPTIGLIGEAGPEAIVPLSKKNSMGTTVIVNVGGNVTSERDLVDVIGDALTKKMQFNQAMAG